MPRSSSTTETPTWRPLREAAPNGVTLFWDTSGHHDFVEPAALPVRRFYPNGLSLCGFVISRATVAQLSGAAERRLPGRATTNPEPAGDAARRHVWKPRRMTDAPLMPAAFLGHGTPMNALNANRYTETWSTFGSVVPRPTAILAISAHWYINATAVTAMARPRTIHDFYGFPDELFAVDYPAPGDPALATEICDLVKPTWIGQDHDSWGIDHGTWSVLVHAFPAADIPVVQLAVNATKPFEYHLALGARLAPLRARGVLIVASGNLVHNLYKVAWDQPDSGYEWASRFDEKVIRIMATDPANLVSVRHDNDYELAVPTPDHFIPLLYIAGLASSAEEEAEVLIQGCTLGSLSMTCFTVGCPTMATNPLGSPPPVLPDLAADEINL